MNLHYQAARLLLAGDIHPNPGPRNCNKVGCLYLNAKSLKTVTMVRNKLLQFHSMVDIYKPHLIGVTETWITSEVDNKEILGSEYLIHRKDRATTGGGVLLAVHNSIKSKRLDKLESKNKNFNEMLVVELSPTHSPKFAVIVCYKPPGVTNLIFADNLKHILTSIVRKGITNINILGDINIPEINWAIGYPKATAGIAFELCKLFQEHGLTQCNLNPSRNASENILDVVLSSEPDNISEIKSLEDILDSDHFILKFNIKIKNRPPRNTTRRIFNFKKFDFDRIKQHPDIHRLDNIVDEAGNNIDNAWLTWKDCLLRIINRVVPKITIRHKRNLPWIDREVIHQSHRKESQRRKAKRTNNRRHWDRYKFLNNNLKVLIRRKHKEYIDKCADDLASNPKRFWGLVNSKQHGNGIPHTVRFNQETSRRPVQMANLFNKYFHSVLTPPVLNLVLPVIPKVPDDELREVILTQNDVRSVITKLNKCKAIGNDGIPTTVLINCIDVLVPSMCKLFNLSLTLCKLPNEWKCANVVPVFKKGSIEDVSNYRPISLLPIISMGLERCILNKIIANIISKIHPCQHGFMQGKSSVTQLLEVYTDINRTLDNSGQVDAIFLDFAKAFDSVSHPLLIHKLESFGFQGPLLNWFSDYLTHRTQKVNINQVTSGILPVMSGVPQGSILGPILFLIYINDMPLHNYKGTRVALFADDTKIYRQINSVRDCRILQAELTRLVKWSKDWHMEFNVDKCKSMSINRKISPYVFNYSMSGTRLEKVKQFRDLGVIVTDTLSWDIHIENMVKRANRNLWMVMRTLGYSVSLKAKKLMYIAYVRSLLEYASQVWSPCLVKSLKIIESVQRRATKFMLNNINIPYKERLLRTKLLPLSFRRELLDLKCLHQSLFGSSNLRGMFPPKRGTRYSAAPNMLRSSNAKTECYRAFYSQRANLLWNKLDSETRSLQFIQGSQIFNNRVNAYYFHKLNTSFNVNNTCTWINFCGCTQCRSI